MTVESTTERVCAALPVDMSNSPHCLFRPVGAHALVLTDSFWEPRIRANREITIPSQLAHCESTGRIENFRRAAGKSDAAFQGIYFNDSDVYKWLEAASWSLATHPDEALDAMVDKVIAEVAAAQQPDGYLNTYFMFEREAERFTNLKDMHEIYCAGHLFQAAVAHHRATGKRSLLEVACRLADRLYELFGPNGRLAACGHEEAEMGLVELYRAVTDRRYLDLAERMLQARGQTPPILGGSPYHQDHLPVTQQRHVTGHAVRQLYLCCGMADVVAESGRIDYLEALDSLWNSFTQRRMYVTGGAGSRWEGEAFGEDFELPNSRAYTETCAAIGSVMWNWRMLHLTGLPQYADVMEMTLYNAVLPGLSLDAKRYFYQNPLEDRGKHRREEWFGCACCPPNVARLLASLTGYFYSIAPNSVFIHLYASGTVNITLSDGSEVRLRQITDYPWSGDIEIAIEAAPEHEIAIGLRIPFWCDEEETLLFVNGVDAGDRLTELPGRYCEIRKAWKAGDRIRLSLPMPVERIESHPFVTGNRGRVALQRGPLVYCIEQADVSDCDVFSIAIPDQSEFRLAQIEIEEHRIIALQADAVSLDIEEWRDSLYAPYCRVEQSDYSRVTITAIPYYAWANREAGPMLVWLPVASDC